MKLTELQEQGGLYRTILKKCLVVRGDDSSLISLVFVVGKPLAHEGISAEQADTILTTFNARVVTYERLIAEAKNAYQAYLDRSREFDRIVAILEPEPNAVPDVSSSDTPSK